MQIYVINLDRSPQRLAHITQIFADMGLNFTRVTAIDGANLSDEALIRLTEKCHWHKPLTPNEVGCLLSHRHCLRLAAMSEAPYSAIFEDDILLSPKISSLLQDWHWIPEGSDIIKLDTAAISCLTDTLEKNVSSEYRLRRLLDKHYCTGGYIVAKEAAMQLYHITQDAFAPIDEIYYNPDCGILTKFNIQQMVPAPVMQAGLPSTIRGESLPTSYQTDCLNLRSKKTLPFFKKQAREWQRIKKKHLRPLWLTLTRQACWGKIDFG